VTASTTGFNPDYQISAGDYLTVVLATLGLSQSDLAARTGLSTKHINQVIKRGATISPEIATHLEYATGVPAEAWAALDARYQAGQAREKTRRRLSASLSWLDRFNLPELAERHVISSAARTVTTMEQLLRYFAIADPEGWDRVWQPSLTSFRRSPAFQPDATATTVWLRAGQRAASQIDVTPYDTRTLQSGLEEVRRLTTLDASEALPALQHRMADFGVAVVYVAEFDGCRASGATWWTSPTKAVVALSNRGKKEDRFWFSFFHELGHVLHHAKRDTFLDQANGATEPDAGDGPPWGDPPPRSGFIDDGSRDSRLEEEADSFASITLIPPTYAGRIAAIRSTQDVKDLAAAIGVSPGIVAGRYQYETRNYSKYNQLRRTVPHDLFLAA
jgi:HTH-type transcriptional regulator / antitoxin HigA